MATRLDYLEKIDPHQLETRYIDILLEGWAKWAAPERGPSPPVATGILLRIASIREAEYQLRISDDEFTLVDSRIAILARRLREIVELEYRGFWQGTHYSLSQEEKWRKVGARRTAYKERLTAAQWTLYTLLLPQIEVWKQRNETKR